MESVEPRPRDEYEQLGADARKRFSRKRNSGISSNLV